MRKRSSAVLVLAIGTALAVSGCGVTGAPPAAVAPFSVLVILGSGSGGFSGQPAAGVVVTVTPAGGSAVSQTTDASGRANFSSSPSGVYDVSAAPPSTLPAAALTIRDLNVATTGRDIVLVLVHRLPSDQTPPRTISGPFTGTITGTLKRADGSPQAGPDNCSSSSASCQVPGNVGIVTYTGLFDDITNATGGFTINRTGMSNERPAVTGSLFGGNWDGVGGLGSGVLGATHLYFTQYAYDPAVNLIGGTLAYGDFPMANVTGSLPTVLDSEGKSFLAPFDSESTVGFSLTDLFLYHAIHSLDLWLGEVYHDSTVTSVTTPIPQISLAQSVYWYGLGFAGALDTSTFTFTVFGLTTTYLTSGATALNVSYLPRPGTPTVGTGNPPAISWAASSGATVYEVDVFDAGGNLVYYAATSSSLSVTLPAALPAGSYSVMVFANDSLTSADYIGRERLRPALRARGGVLRPGTLRFRAARGDRAQLVRSAAPLRQALRAGGALHRPLLDRTPFSNNDDRWSRSDMIAFTR
ncbi:MAG: hypothetical protein QN152_03565 [Armatimonadota bacterium]|nr:hypothetical protein [Armatimonadota bacterium]MDR7465292.1 hypothetical protein [Armatimonadota bacterium]MDR7468765.1 hypothetical protein [Armatimonadota bacterium]MDR7473714.1 hypothetical protein [Armatimonadota bacterium]MDR7538592.1 hypothetical protein [Armatimonadota bacterium]